MSAIAKPIGTPFIELRSVESTNNYAMGMVHARMAHHGTCVFAHEQTRGRGQREKHWVSGTGKDIILSLIVEPFGLAPSQQFSLSMAVALGVYRFFNHYTHGDAAIKWPNDLYWRDRKAGGILIENVLQGHQWQWSVIGIGINVNETAFPAMERTPVSLRQITGKTHDTLALSRQLLHHLQEAFNQLASSETSIRNDYTAALYRRNEEVAFRQGNRSFRGKVAGVAPNGQLIVHTPLEEHFNAGELVWA